MLLRMYALNDYTLAEAIANLPLTGNMQPSTLMVQDTGASPYRACSLFLPTSCLPDVSAC